MTEPLSDERLAEIRAGLDRGLTEGDKPFMLRGTLRALLSRLDKAEAGWQDISTAPKDGTEVLLFGISPYDGPVQDVGYWPEMGSAVWVWCYVFEPTHWRPLPPPPSES